jgi:tetratricopeptide (TPR) repeat protein
MDCESASRENVVERYLAGTLDPQTMDEWEQHLFTCDHCTEQLEICRTIQPVLREMAPQIRGEMSPPAPARRWLWIAVPLVASILIFAVITVNRTPQLPPRQVASHPQDLSLLARLDPPAYNAPSLRGLPTPAQTKFHDAMTAYQNHDWQAAIAALQGSLDLDPAPAAPRFFLGASYLLGGDARSAATELERVAATDSPFSDEARFVLAKAYLALGRKSDAIAALQQCHGDFAPQAADLLSRIQ